MRTIPAITSLILALASPAVISHAQTAGTVSAAPSAKTVNVSPGEKLDESSLDFLLGPIALYPDALIGIILPAATVPSDIVLAARFLEDGGELEDVDDEPWDKSVQSLVRYPEVLQWMDDNLAWTQQLGSVFLMQPEEVMITIQRLRTRAQTVGNLQSNQQLTVVKDEDYIRIIPTTTEYIYVPYYDPDIIYVSRFNWYFGPAWPCGPWLFYDCNWVSRSIWFEVWAPGHFRHPGWRPVGRPLPPPAVVNRHTWRPNPNHPRPPRPVAGAPILRPRPPAGAPRPPAGHATAPGRPGRGQQGHNRGAPPSQLPTRPDDAGFAQTPPPSARPPRTRQTGAPAPTIPGGRQPRNYTAPAAAPGAPMQPAGLTDSGNTPAPPPAGVTDRTRPSTPPGVDNQSPINNRPQRVGRPESGRRPSQPSNAQRPSYSTPPPATSAPVGPPPQRPIRERAGPRTPTTPPPPPRPQPPPQPQPAPTSQTGKFSRTPPPNSTPSAPKPAQQNPSNTQSRPQPSNNTPPPAPPPPPPARTDSSSNTSNNDSSSRNQSQGNNSRGGFSQRNK